MQVGVLGHLVITDGPTTIPAWAPCSAGILARLGLEPGSPVSFMISSRRHGVTTRRRRRATRSRATCSGSGAGIEIDTTDDRYVLHYSTSAS